METFTTTSITENYSKVDSFSEPAYGVNRIDYSDKLSNQIQELQVACRGALSHGLMYAYYMAGKTMERYQLLPNGWDGLGSIAPTERQKSQAIFGLLALLKHQIPAPNTMVFSNGTIGVYWERGSWYVSLDFECDGGHPWVAINGSSTLSGTWNCDEPLPDDFWLAFTPFPLRIAA